GPPEERARPVGVDPLAVEPEPGVAAANVEARVEEPGRGLVQPDRPAVAGEETGGAVEDRAGGDAAREDAVAGHQRDRPAGRERAGGRGGGGGARAGRARGGPRGRPGGWRGRGRSPWRPARRGPARGAARRTRSPPAAAGRAGAARRRARR